jgi:hypothetical protein
MIRFFGTEMNPWTGSEKILKRWVGAGGKVEKLENEKIEGGRK